MDEIQKSPIPESRFRRSIYVFVTIILPILSFLLSYDGYLLGPEWQSGELSDYAGIMLEGRVSVLFYPFLIYAMISYILLLYSYPRFSKYFIIRFGIYSGVVLSLQYAVLLIISSSDSGGLVFLYLAFLLPFLIEAFYSKSIRRFGIKRVKYTIVLLLFLISIITIISEDPGWIIFVLVGIFISGPIWNLIISTLTSIYLFRTIEVSQSHKLEHHYGVFAWLFAYIVAWRFAVLKTIEIYNALPTSPPDCYIATTAAKGHPGIVKSRVISMPGGSVTRINPQLRYFKCAELVLLIKMPVVHKVCRKFYDYFGTRLAGNISSAIAADLVYLSLKPVEWFFKLLLKMLVPELDEVTDRIYPRAVHELQIPSWR